jgi:hypothetical protein
MKSTYESDFDQNKYSISLKENFFENNEEQFSKLRDDFSIPISYPIENELVEAYVEYIQYRDSIN